MDQEILLEVKDNDLHLRRLDIFLSKKIPTLSRQQIKKLFQSQHIYPVDSTLKLELKTLPPRGTLIAVAINQTIQPTLTAQNIPLDIHFQDEHLIIINKQAGMVVHPGAGGETQTLLNALLHHYPEIKDLEPSSRPGIVHRLDKGTTGLMVVAKSQICYNALVDIFKEHLIKRSYWAIVMGTKIPPQTTIETLIARHPKQRLKMSTQVDKGKKAITHVRLLESYQACSLVEFILETGRTHQIRVHCAEKLRTPILGDPLYGNRTQQLKRLDSSIRPFVKLSPYPLLHAKTLGFVHPITKKQLSFTAPIPEHFANIQQKLKLCP